MLIGKEERICVIDSGPLGIEERNQANLIGDTFFFTKCFLIIDKSIFCHHKPFGLQSLYLCIMILLPICHERNDSRDLHYFSVVSTNLNMNLFLFIFFFSFICS